MGLEMGVQIHCLEMAAEMATAVKPSTKVLSGPFISRKRVCSFQFSPRNLPGNFREILEMQTVDLGLQNKPTLTSFQKAPREASLA